MEKGEHPYYVHGNAFHRAPCRLPVPILCFHVSNEALQLAPPWETRIIMVELLCSLTVLQNET